METRLILKSKELATALHKGQFRFDKTTPYINHPAKVAEIVEKLGGDERHICAAWLHDVLEYCEFTFAELASEVGGEIAGVVSILTKKAGEDYAFSIQRLNKNPIARLVKIADNLANLGDSPTKKQVKKYSYSLVELLTMP